MNESGAIDKQNINRTKLIAGAVLLVVLALLYILFALRGSEDTANTAATTDTATMQTQSSTPAATESTANSTAGSSQTAAAYRDGTYTTTGSYRTPVGTESITATLTVAGNTVTESSVQTTGHDPTSVMYQDEFKNNYKPLVVGKKLDDIQLRRVSGSSLTSGGFNKALEAIKQDALAQG
ncbi:MAG TPA: hypothetical protein VK978_03690 [Candidatus Saccharimonadales bacterium]|nr:hypothetical protein [Candidatus Saccharimonadales bacterium]